MKLEDLRKDLAFLGGMGGALIGYFFFQAADTSPFVAGVKAGLGAMIGSGLLMAAGGILYATKSRDRVVYLFATVILSALALILITEYAAPPGSGPRRTYTLF